VYLCICMKNYINLKVRRECGETHNKFKKSSTHHSIDFNVDDEVLGDVVKADEVWEIQTATDHCFVG